MNYNINDNFLTKYYSKSPCRFSRKSFKVQKTVFSNKQNGVFKKLEERKDQNPVYSKIKLIVIQTIKGSIRMARMRGFTG